MIALKAPGHDAVTACEQRVADGDQIRIQPRDDLWFAGLERAERMQVVDSDLHDRVGRMDGRRALQL